MKSGRNASKVEEDAPGGRSGTGKPPHWRHREQATATTVYVVHPTQFRTVVQLLTGPGAAALPPPLNTHAGAAHQHVACGGGGGGGGNGAAAAGTRTNAVVKVQHGGGGGRTMGQMHQACLDWANADDD